MRIPVTYLFIIAFGNIQGQDYSANDRYNDSVLIYDTYLSQIKELRSIKTTDENYQQKWWKIEYRADTLTACARRRLQLYNKKTYMPDSTIDQEGLGTAYRYPKPSEIEHSGRFVSEMVGPKKRFIVYDYQTRFVYDEDNGRTKTPYIRKLIFDKGRLLYIEKLNPITKEDL